MTVIWNDKSLKARVKAAQPVAAREWLAVAKARFPSRSIASSFGLNQRGTTSHVTGRSEWRFFEEGVPRHIIEPKGGKVLRLANGEFVSGPVEHPGMRAQPTIKPLLQAWPTTYRRRARTFLR